MSVSDTVNVSGNAQHTYREVERGVNPFTVTHQITGDGTGGVMATNFRFNPGSQASFQPWVVITRIGIRTTTAAATGGWWAHAQLANWEDHPTYDGFLAGGTFTQQESGSDFFGSWYGNVVPGRIAKATFGVLPIRFANVNTMIANVTLEGFISDHAVLGRWWLSR